MFRAILAIILLTTVLLSACGSNNITDTASAKEVVSVINNALEEQRIVDLIHRSSSQLSSCEDVRIITSLPSTVVIKKYEEPGSVEADLGGVFCLVTYNGGQETFRLY